MTIVMLNKKNSAYLSQIIITFSLFCFLLYFIYQAISSLGYNIIYDRIILTYLSIGTISWFSIYKSIVEIEISTALIHWFFLFVFFFMVPVVQYSTNFFVYLDNSEMDKQYLFYTNIAILTWILCYKIGYMLLGRLYTVNFNFNKNKRFHTETINKRLSIFLWIITVSFVLIVSSIGIGPFLARSEGGIFSTFFNSYGPIVLILEMFIKPLIISTAIGVSILIFKHNVNIKKSILFFLIIFAFVFNMPTALPRSFVFLYLILFYVLRMKTSIKYSVRILVLLFLGIYASFLINIFRYITTSTSFSLSVGYDDFFSGHFDSYENFVWSTRYIYEKGLLMGSSILGAVFFFIPRAIWADKPVGSGTFISEVYFKNISEFGENAFTNIANSNIAEFLLNFGVIGVIIFGIFYGLFNGIMDRTFKKNMTLNNTLNHHFFSVIYGIIAGLYILHMRGDFLSTFAFSSGIVLSFVISTKILQIDSNISFEKTIIKNESYTNNKS